MKRKTIDEKTGLRSLQHGDYIINDVDSFMAENPGVVKEVTKFQVDAKIFNFLMSLPVAVKHVHKVTDREKEGLPESAEGVKLAVANPAKKAAA